MRFAREIRRAASEMPAGVGDLFHFTSNEVRYFTIFDRKLFHVLHSKTFHFPIFPTVPTVPFATASKKQQPYRQSVKNASKKFRSTANFNCCGRPFIFVYCDANFDRQNANIMIRFIPSLNSHGEQVYRGLFGKYFLIFSTALL